MLSESHLATIEATLPAVGAAIPEITPNFYGRLFGAHPDLLDNLFNRTHQKTGAQPQALAGSVAAYAQLQLVPDRARQQFILKRIAHKHASLGITRDQYQIVHKYLFEAIVDVLGEAVTPEVAEAWDALYWQMADALITEENHLYQQAGVAPGDVWRDVVVTGRQYQSPDTISLTIAATDGSPLPSFHAGQYISVQVPLADGARQIRQYSLTGATDRPDWQISIKNVGEVSGFLHEQVFEGDTLHVSTPFGDLVVPDDGTPLLIASAGIGCTPAIGVLTALAAQQDSRHITVLHADRSRARQPHRGQLAALVEQLPNAQLTQWYEEGHVPGASDRVRTGFMNLEGVDLQDDSHALLCGPAEFLSAIRAQLIDRGIPENQIHYETFGPELVRVGAA
ncbi:hemin transporter [Gordonia pseudamarae]|jgi:nitric oxide dioxygenase|uniref:nitric oxide dioxygenase n=1 Tax=Gordonia pseudamarae TaxID=2831662 RepID=A0ABX6IGF6_9ACTN|nr:MULTISPECIES: globin domain-containing protein [Gordonia]MBD0023529.1 hemin transporter [Gordonia sp. (in: high G+C Gram-positive bacteria)]QHN26027.1 hemin transporter [Gordonia pseudamarae]QHN34951.1 hemin transporter [Gordonia pseudamarae]